MRGWHNLFCMVILYLEYEDVEEDGKLKTLNNATLNQFLKNKDEKVRKQAYTNFFKEYQRYENVFAQTLAGVMKRMLLCRCT